MGVMQNVDTVVGVPLFTLRLPWERLLVGKWDTTLRRRAFDGLIHLVLTSHANRKPRAGGYVPLSYDAVADLLGKSVGPDALAAAQEIGIIECDQQGKAGRQYHGYRLTADALSYGGLVMRAPAGLAKKLNNRRQMRPEVANNPVHQQMLRTLRKVSIGDSMGPVLTARVAGSGLLSGLCAVHSVDAIRRGHWRLSADRNTGRVFHNVANFPSELRPHLLLDGHAIGEADIASSQPYFLAALAYKGDHSAEARQFRELVTSERFYESMGEWAGVSTDDRKALKERFYSEVLFGLRRYRGKLWAALAARFPRLAEYVDRVKSDDYRALARLLQSEEARVVIGRIVPALAAQGIEALTIHDGILARRDQLEDVRRVMIAELERATGIKPHVRIKDTSSPRPLASDVDAGLAA